MVFALRIGPSARGPSRGRSAATSHSSRRPAQHRDTEANARPGGVIRAFWEPDTTTSIPQSILLERDGPEARDRVDHAERPASGCACRDRANVGDDAGRRLTLRAVDDARAADLRELRPYIGWIRRLSPFVPQVRRRHTRSVRRSGPSARRSIRRTRRAHGRPASRDWRRRSPSHRSRMSSRG